MTNTHISESAKTVGDGVSIGTIALTLLEKMPEIAALAAFIWTLIRIYETQTIQKLIHKKKKPSKDGKQE